MSEPVTTTQRFAWILGLAGLLPFLAHTLLAWVTSPLEVEGLMRSQAHYAAAILTFVGALHWGVVLASPSIVDARAARRMVWSVLPSILAWLITLYDVRMALVTLMCALPVALAVDWLLYRETPVPRWFMAVRITLTTVATLMVALTWLAGRVRVPA